MPFIPHPDALHPDADACWGPDGVLVYFRPYRNDERSDNYNRMLSPVSPLDFLWDECRYDNLESTLFM